MGDLWDDLHTWGEAPFTTMGATFSPCRTWRTKLWRRWSSGPAMLAIFLNPSTADEQANDPTVARTIRRAQRLGFGALRVGNVYAYRATDPQDMLAAKARGVDIVGPGNDAALVEMAEDAGMILCGWGAHGAARRADIVRLLGHRQLHRLASTATGEPGHPLYLGYDLTPQVWHQP